MVALLISASEGAPVVAAAAALVALRQAVMDPGNAAGAFGS
jgi:hypothetical protein